MRGVHGNSAVAFTPHIHIKGQVARNELSRATSRDPKLDSHVDPQSAMEFARRLGEVAAVISDQPWEIVEPMLAALWDESKSATDWSAAQPVAQRAWLATKRFY